MQNKLSILISSFKRLNLLKRTLFNIAVHPINTPYEVILADEITEESPQILEELHKYDARFSWTFVAVNFQKFEEKTGIKKFYNNPSLTNNVAFGHSSGNLICLMGNEVIATKNAFNELVSEAEKLNTQYYNVFTTTYNMPENVQIACGEYGANLTQNMINYCKQYPLQHPQMRGMVTNYLSLSSRATWKILEGYDYRFLEGIAGDDSFFVLRAKKLPNYQEKYIDAISLHQDHAGRTMYKEQDPKNITNERWDEGLAKNRKIIADWQNGITQENDKYGL